MYIQVSLVVYIHILVSHKKKKKKYIYIYIKQKIYINSKVPLDNLVMLWGWAGGLLPRGGPALLPV